MAQNLVVDFVDFRLIIRGSARMSIPKMSIPKMSIPIMSTVPKCLVPLCLLCQNVYSQNVYPFVKNAIKKSLLGSHLIIFEYFRRTHRWTPVR